MITADYATRADIATVMFDEEIFDRTNPDGVKNDKDINDADLTGWVFIGGYIRGRIASLFIMKGDQLHFWVLKPYRRYARKLLDASFNLWPRTVWVEIPVLYTSVINFAKNYGFKESRLIKDAYMKNGKLYDKQILRFEWDQ